MTERLERRIDELYGTGATAEMASGDGTIHVTAVWEAPNGDRTVLAIEDGTPSSETDQFVLALARARADAIVATGRILREEPDVTFEIDGPERADLVRWRREVRGRTEGPIVLILTSGRDVDFGHPAFVSTGIRPVIYTSSPTIAPPKGVELVHDANPTARRALDYLRAIGARTISVEAGPSTVRELYESPVAIDELMLSVVRGGEAPPLVRGGGFFDAEAISRVLGPSASNLDRQEDKGSGAEWRFLRHVRR